MSVDSQGMDQNCHDSMSLSRVSEEQFSTLGTMPDYGTATVLATAPPKVAACILGQCDECHGLLMQGIDVVYLLLQEERKGGNCRVDACCL